MMCGDVTITFQDHCRRIVVTEEGKAAEDSSIEGLVEHLYV